MALALPGASHTWDLHSSLSLAVSLPRWEALVRRDELVQSPQGLAWLRVPTQPPATASALAVLPGHPRNDWLASWRR